MSDQDTFGTDGRFVVHPLIVQSSLDFREYQVNIAERCLQANTLVTLPTGLGKTMIAVLVAAERLRRNPRGWCAMLAPTRPLISQHYQVFSSKLSLPENAFGLWTGEVPVGQRTPVKQGILFATPQTFRNEVVKGLDISNLVLVVFDEAHRATGDYPYVFLAEIYRKRARTPLVLAMTASPASSEQKLMEVSRNLMIDRFEMRTERAEEVKPFVKETEFRRVPVSLPDVILEARSLITREISDQLVRAKALGLFRSQNPSFREMTEAMKLAGLKARETNGSSDYLSALPGLAVARRLKMALERLDLGGPSLLFSFLRSLSEKSRRPGAIRSLKMIVTSRRVNDAMELARIYTLTNRHDPKQEELLRIAERELRNGVQRIIVFVSYRAVASKLVEFLTDVNASELRPYYLVGHAKKGMSSHQQLEAISKFGGGDYNILVTTQVGEEGLDISGSDVVIFYDNTPSALRFIQRSGRTGRTSPGRVYMMFFKGTLDERYMWIAKRREARMKEIISGLSERCGENEVPEEKPSLRVFMEREDREQGRVVIVVDTREQSSGVVEELSKLGAEIRFSQLSVGDYILSERVAVERKTSGDFAISLMDGRLFSQAKELKQEFQIPVLVVEGEDMFVHPGISENAILGALSSLAIDFSLPVLRVKDVSETSRLLYLMATREQVKEKRMPRVREGRKPPSLYEMQVYLLSGLPFVERLTAERLLSKFRTPAGVFKASERDLMEVDGIGERKARSIKSTIEKEATGDESDSGVDEGSH